jgi:hypothetical protein
LGGRSLTGGEGLIGVGLAVADESREAFLHGTRSSMGDETIVTLDTFGDRAVTGAGPGL